jgi:hypothetical protein
MITPNDDLVAATSVGLLAVLTTAWIVLLAVDLATTGEVRVFGGTTAGPAAVVDRMIDVLAVQRGGR